MVSDSRPGTCDMADDALFRLGLKEVTLRTFDDAAAKLDEIIDRRFTELIEMIKSLAKAPSPAAMEALVTETSLELQSEEAAVTDALQTRKPPSNSMSNSMPKVIISEFENDAGFGKSEVLTAEVCVESIKTELDFEYELFSEVADKVGSIDLKNKASLTDIEKCFSRVCENKLAGFGRCFIIPPLKPPDIVINTDESPPKKPPDVARSHTQFSGDTELKPLICLKSVKDFCIYSARHNVTGFGAFNPTLGTIIPVMGGFAVGTIDGSVAVAASLGATAAGPSDTKMARMIEGVDEFEFNNKVSSTALAECIPTVCENACEIKLTRFEACFNLRPKKPPDDTKTVSTVFAVADMLPYNLLMKFFVKKPTGMIGGVGDRLSTASVVRSLLPGLDCEFVVNLVLEDLPQKDPWHAHILGIMCIWVGGSSTKGPGGIVSKILTEPIGGNHTLSRSPVGILDSKIVFEEWLILEYTRKLALAEIFFIQILRPFPKDKVGWSLKVTFPALFMRLATASMSIYQFLIIVGQHDKYWQNDQWALLYKYIEKYWQDDRLELGESMILCCTLCTHADMVPFITTLVDNLDMIVSTSHDKSLILWNLTKSDKNFSPRHHSNLAQDMVLSIDGHFALYGSWDSELRLWIWGAGVSAKQFNYLSRPFLSRTASSIDMLNVMNEKEKVWGRNGEWKKRSLIHLFGLWDLESLRSGSKPMKQLSLMISFNVVYSTVEMLLGLITGLIGGTNVSILAFDVANMIAKGANLMQSLSDQNIKFVKKDINAFDRTAQDYHQKFEEMQALHLPSKVEIISLLESELKKRKEVFRSLSLKTKSLWSKSIEEIVEKVLDVVTFVQQEIILAFGGDNETMFMKVSAKASLPINVKDIGSGIFPFWADLTHFEKQFEFEP